MRATYSRPFSCGKLYKKVQKTIDIMARVIYNRGINKLTNEKGNEMKKYQVWNSSDRLVFEGNEQEFDVFRSNIYLNDSDKVKIVEA